MSNLSNTPNSPAPKKIWPFVAASYEGHTITIRRDPSYNVSPIITHLIQRKQLKEHLQGSIMSIKQVFRELKTMSEGRIRLSSTFDGFGDGPIQITPEMWPELISELKVVLVTVDSDKRKNADMAPLIDLSG
jgi:hypothetical protein